MTRSPIGATVLFLRHVGRHHANTLGVVVGHPGTGDTCIVAINDGRVWFLQEHRLYASYAAKENPACENCHEHTSVFRDTVFDRYLCSFCVALHTCPHCFQRVDLPVTGGLSPCERCGFPDAHR